METDLRRLQDLLLNGHRLITVSTAEEEDALTLVRTAVVEMGLDSLLWSNSRGLRDGALANTAAVADSEHPAAALYYLATLTRRVVAVMLDLAPHLKDERTLRQLRDVLLVFKQTGSHLVLIDAAGDLPPAVRPYATAFDLSLPGEKELESLVRETLREVTSTSTSGRGITVDLSRRDLAAVVRNLRGLTRRQAKQVVVDSIGADRRFDARDINSVLAEKRRHLGSAGMLEYVESPVDIDEIGGLRRLKFWLEQRRDSLGEEAVQFGIEAPRGVLMLGVQGAGKSLAAKAVATAWQRPLLRMDVGALYDRYVGESERRLREALRQAESMAPLVLWIDEVEKAFASAAAQSTDGGLSKRMFGTLLTWMQEHRAPVFLVATANDIEALPPELLRKGRFDEIFFVDLPDEGARREIFRIHLTKRKRDLRGFDLDELARLSEGFSGAEVEQAVVAAMHDAFAHRVPVTTAHVADAIRRSPPLSVTMRERLTALRTWSQGRCVPAD